MTRDIWGTWGTVLGAEWDVKVRRVFVITVDLPMLPDTKLPRGYRHIVLAGQIPGLDADSVIVNPLDMGNR